MFKSIEVRTEKSGKAITEQVEVNVPTGAYHQIEDGTFVPVTDKKLEERLIGYDDTDIQVIGVLFDDARETYYERDYGTLISDIGEEKASLAAGLAGWIK